MPDLKNKVALITGASSGIGESTALHFASLGCWLSLMARNEGALQRVAEACRAQGIPRDKVLVVRGDVSVEADVAAVVDKTAEHFERIDILVNSAGISDGATMHCSTEVFERIMGTNLHGPRLMMQRALPYLRKTRGSIVNVSSVTSMAAGLIAPYCVSKAALDHLTRCAALENASYGVRINAVNPGVILTPIGRSPEVSEEEHFEFMTKLGREAHPMGRVGMPEEVARCIAFLASADASFVTGITMPVDGGCLLLASVGSRALRSREAQENAPDGVRVNAVNPGVILTPIGRSPEVNEEEHFEFMRKLGREAHPMGRVGMPEEVARCIAFVASADASFVTGITMPIDGGLLLLSTISSPALRSRQAQVSLASLQYTAVDSEPEKGCHLQR